MRGFGPLGIVAILVVLAGSAAGAIFAVTGQIWMPMIAHAMFDMTAVAIIYWDVESAVAHLVFR